MIKLVKIVLIIAIAGDWAIADDEDLSRYSTEISVIVGGEETTTELPVQKKWGERIKKPFLYGRKFQLPKESGEGTKDELYSPIITSPIRALGEIKTEPDVVKQNQNEILSSIRDFLRETTESTFNKTYFSEEAQESENHGGEATTESPEPNPEDASVSRSRQDADRSLMVVLPFKANDDNIQELFTKSPLVKLIETRDDLEKESKGTTFTPQIIEKEIVPTTEKIRKRWRPLKRYRTTTEAYTTTTEVPEDLTKTYTNYNDAELVTKKYETEVSPIITNHKELEIITTPYPVEFTKRFKNKLKEDVQFSTTTEKFTSKQKPKRKGQRRKPTTAGPPKPEDLSKILEILPPDMKDLLLEIGLDKENKEQSEVEEKFRLERIPQPSIDPMSYAIFKPLPLEAKDENRNFVPDDMKDFLASFGLLPSGKRNEKSLRLETTPQPSDVDLDFLPDDLKAVLEDMGLVRYSSKKEPTRIHIFNPSNHSHSDEDLEKLNAILTSIKTTANESTPLSPETQSEIIEKIRDLSSLRNKAGNGSEINNEIQKVASSTAPRIKSTSKRATKLIEGPDPLMFSEETVSKNDVKRQTSASSSSASSSSSGGNSASSASSSSAAGSDAASSASASSSATGDSASSSSSASAADTTTTTEEAPNIEALKESFGGGETASDDEDIESSLPPKRPNGLYLLLDWNSFLEVGTEDDNRKVNLRFQPKIGDSRNFLPVSVP